MAHTTVEIEKNQVRGIALQMAEKAPATNRIANKRLENRRANLRQQIQLHGGPKAFAALVGKPQSFISQMCGPTPSRNVSEETARDFESKLDLQVGELDWPASGNGAHAAPSPIGADLPADATAFNRDASTIALLISVVRNEQIHLPDLKFGEVVMVALADAKDTGRTPSPEKLRALIALATPKS